MHGGSRGAEIPYAFGPTECATDRDRECATACGPGDVSCSDPDPHLDIDVGSGACINPGTLDT